MSAINELIGVSENRLLTRFLQSGTHPEPPQADLDPLELATLISNARRVHVIEHLARTDEVLSTRDLAEPIAEREREDGQMPGQARKRVYVALHQTHLSKLAKAGIVEEVRNGHWRAGPNLAGAHSAVVALRERSRDGEVSGT